MTTRRRLLALVAGVLAVAGLVGCRSEPDVAAYVGDDRITEDRVTEIFDDARRTLADALRKQAEDRAKATGQPVPSEPPQVQMPINRQDVVVMMVGREVFKAAAEKKGLSPVEIPADAVAEQIRLPAEAGYAKIYREYLGYRVALIQQSAPKTPTEADLQDVYARLVAAGGAGPEASFEEFRSTLQGQNLQLVSAAVALRDAVAPEVAAADVTVNPRYGAPELELLGFADQQGGRHMLVVLPLDGTPAAPPVVDAG